MKTATLLESRHALAAVRAVRLPSCICNAFALVRVPGDVAMCRCGYWYLQDFDGIYGPLTPADAAALARAPLPNDVVLAAFERAADELDRLRT